MQNVLRNPGHQPFEPADFRLALLAGDFRQCRALIGRSRPTTVVALAAAKVALRERRYAEALATLTLAAPTKTEEKLEHGILLALALGSTSELPAARELIERVLKSVMPASGALRADAMYARAIIAWMEHDDGAARHFASSLLGEPDANDRARAHILLSWVCAHERDLQTQTEHLGKALDTLEAAPEPDEYYRANALYGLATLCREIRLGDTTERIKKVYERLPWTDGLALQHFQTTRFLAWIDALEGNELAAFARFKVAAQLAPSRQWKAVCLLDRAVLARSTGERGFALDQLYEAHELASSLSWDNTPGEELAALILLGELFADVNPELSQQYLAQFRSLTSIVTPALVHGNDPRIRAFARYSEGIALGRLHRSDESIAALKEAHEIFQTHGYEWRSSLCALALVKATGKAAWLKKAQEQIRSWPKSWIARDVAAVPIGERSATVPPAQQAVLSLLLEGKRNREIARELGRSPHTIRNQIADLFKTFGVRSRAELIARVGAQALQAGAA